MANKATSRIRSWVRNIDKSIDKEILKWIRTSQQKASDAARAFNRLILGDDGTSEEDDYSAYSSQSSRRHYQNGVEATVQTFHDARGNRVEEVYLDGMLAERYINGVPM